MYNSDLLTVNKKRIRIQRCFQLHLVNILSQLHPIHPIHPIHTYTHTHNIPSPQTQTIVTPSHRQVKYTDLDISSLTSETIFFLVFIVVFAFRVTLLLFKLYRLFWRKDIARLPPAPRGAHNVYTYFNDFKHYILWRAHEGLHMEVMEHS